MMLSYRTVAGAAACGAPLPVLRRTEWRRLTALYGCVALLHAAGWGLYVLHAPHHPGLAGLGIAAYLLGLRHAFDADHIAAVDDTVRYMLQQGKRPLGIGFFFSLGHSTVVFALAVAIAIATSGVQAQLPEWQALGGVIGAGVSAAFLWGIGMLNLVVLIDLLKLRREAARGGHCHAHVDELVGGRSLMSRVLGGRLRRLIGQSWQMYPLGVLFGLGFDTASEIALLAMTAGAAAGALPLGAIVSLPLLFAAGMTLLDTTDGVLMLKAYDWAFVNPLRKLHYNVAMTGASVALALVIGTVQAIQLATRLLDLEGPFVNAIARVEFAALGYAIVAAFAVAWIACVTTGRFAHVGARTGTRDGAHAHVHRHASGITHSHRHFH
jgi:nickel/cobalt transporter (NiCoT) family protein